MDQPQPGLPEKNIIRTMKTDTQDILQKEKTSFLDLVTKNKSGGYSMASPTAPRHISERSSSKIFMLLMLTIILALLGGGGYLFVSRTQISKGPVKEEFQPPRPFFSVDDTKLINILNNDRAALIKELINRRQFRMTGQKYTYLPLSISELGKKDYLADPQIFFDTLQITPPSGLLNQMTGRWNTYIYGDDGYVFIFELKDQARAKTQGYMLQWEEKMADDFAPILSDIDSGPFTFNDEVIKNVDARVATLSTQGLILGYSFVLNGKYLILTTSRPALERTIERVIAEPIIQ